MGNVIVEHLQLGNVIWEHMFEHSKRIYERFKDMDDNKIFFPSCSQLTVMLVLK